MVKDDCHRLVKAAKDYVVLWFLSVLYPRLSLTFAAVVRMRPAHKPSPVSDRSQSRLKPNQICCVAAAVVPWSGSSILGDLIPGAGLPSTCWSDLFILASGSG